MDELPMPKCMRTAGIGAPLHRQGYVYSNQCSRDVQILPDSGAQMNLSSRELVQELNIREIPLQRPLRIGSVNDPDAMIVTTKALVTHNMGKTTYEEEFYVAPMTGHPELILGTPWMRKHCPEVLEALEALGENPKKHPVSGGGENATPTHATSAETNARQR